MKCAYRVVRRGRAWLLGFVPLALLCAAQPASAGFAGHSVEASYRFPDFNTVFENLGPILVDPVGTGIFSIGFDLQVDISDTQISLTNNSAPSSFNPGAFNGPSFFDAFSAIDPIVGVSIATNNLPGFDASRITFDADRIKVNLADIQNVPTGLLLTLDVQFRPSPNAVPEPATGVLALFAVGVVAVPTYLRRRRRAA